MAIDARILRDTLERALTRDDFAERFYARLRAASPRASPRAGPAVVARNSAGVERKLFSQRLCTLVDAIDDPEQIAYEARRIASTSDDYGVAPEMYGAVEGALLETLREASGDEWSDEAERSWSAAVEGVASALRAAAAG